MKGYNLPINTTALLVLGIVFLALFFALVSGVADQQVDKLIDLSNNNMPEPAETEGTSFSRDEAEVLQAEYSGNFYSSEPKI